MTSKAASSKAAKDMTALSTDNAYGLAQSLKKGDHVDVWFRRPDGDSWTLWKGVVKRPVVDTTAEGEGRFAWIHYTGDGAPATQMLRFPQEPAVCLYGSATAKIVDPKVEAAKEFVGLALDEDELPDTTTTIDGTCEGEPDEVLYMLDPSQWFRVIKQKAEADIMFRALEKRYENVAGGSEAHDVRWMLESLKSDIRSVVKRPSYCADPSWVKGRQDLLGRLHVLQQKKAGMSNEMLAALDNAMANRDLPPWLREVSKDAMDNSKALAFKSIDRRPAGSSNETPAKGSARGRGGSRGGRRDF
jgi:hypothetical protein